MMSGIRGALSCVDACPTGEKYVENLSWYVILIRVAVCLAGKQSGSLLLCCFMQNYLVNSCLSYLGGGLRLRVMVLRFLR